MAPKVSVIMAVHDGQAHIRDAVDSILSQTLKDVELIIVDDASTDGTAEILARYSDARLCIARNKRRLGPGAARNRALRIARAPLIAIQDADDTSLPHRLEAQVEYLGKNPSVDLTGAYAVTISVQGQEREIMNYPPARDMEIKWALLFWNPFIHSSIMLRRRVLGETGPYAEEGKFAWLAEDYEFLSRISHEHQAANINQVLVRYRINPAGASAQSGNLQKVSEEVSMRNLSRLLGPDMVDVETAQALRRFWFEGKPLCQADAGRVLAADKSLQRAFLSHYLQGGVPRLSRARFYLARSRRAFRQGCRNSHLEPSCRAAMLVSTLALAWRAVA